MFNKSYTCSVTTDANGHFQASTPLEASRMFSFHVAVNATLLFPNETSVSGTFAVAPAPACQFQGSTNQTVDLGKWQVPKGVNQILATGSTHPPRANTPISVRFDACLA